MAKVTYIKGKEPHPREMRLIFRNVDREGWDPSLKTYLAEGGYQALKASWMGSTASTLNVTVQFVPPLNATL